MVKQPKKAIPTPRPQPGAPTRHIGPNSNNGDKVIAARKMYCAGIAKIGQS